MLQTKYINIKNIKHQPLQMYEVQKIVLEFFFPTYILNTSLNINYFPTGITNFWEVYLLSEFTSNVVKDRKFVKYISVKNKRLRKSTSYFLNEKNGTIYRVTTAKMELPYPSSVLKMNYRFILQVRI
jgi:hypothetical protein